MANYTCIVGPISFQDGGEEVGVILAADAVLLDESDAPVNPPEAPNAVMHLNSAEPIEASDTPEDFQRKIQAQLFGWMVQLDPEDDDITWRYL